MTNEREVEVPWALRSVPQQGVILDVGSCEATYLAALAAPGRTLHCLDPRDCARHIPPGVVFHHQSLLGNTLQPHFYDGVLILSTLEHIGLPCYDQQPFADGDKLAVAEIRRLLKPDGYAVVTVPAGRGKVTTWYREYSPAHIQRLFAHWQIDVEYWAFDGQRYVPIPADDVVLHDYRDRGDADLGAGAVACIVARPQTAKRSFHESFAVPASGFLTPDTTA